MEVPFRFGRTIRARQVRRLAARAKDAGQVRRLVAIAAVLDGASREEAAKIGGMDRQKLRDWVIRFNRTGAGRPDQQVVAGRAWQADQRAQGVSCPPGGGKANPGAPWCGALAGLRSDHAAARGVRHLGL